MTLSSTASDVINYTLKSEADYVDVRVENTFSNYVGLRNNSICGVNTNLQKSIGIRVLYKNCWGFASSSSLDNSSIRRIVDTAIKSAKKTAAKNSKPPIHLAKISSRKTSVSDLCEKDPQFLEQKDRITLLNNINRKTASVKEINVLDLKLLENHTQKLFLNSEGSEIEQILIRASLFLGSSISGSGNFQKVRSVGFGGVGGIELFEKDDFDIFHDNFIKTLPEIAYAKLIKPKEQPVILNEEMGWNLCHEFCHAVEADLILSDLSPLNNQIGNKIGSEQVTIIDDASFKGFGEYYFDDEGVKASGTLIVEDGILFDFLQNRETAGETNTIPTSNGRAESALFYPQVRQSNTFFEPGNYSFEELLEQAKNGLFVCDSFGGNADTVHGNFQLDAQYGRKIEKGELSDFVTGYSIIGNLYTVLGDINGMSKDIGSFPSYCGKNGQRVSVGAISPQISLKRMSIVSNIAQRQIRKIDFSGMREI
ncbi:MAG: TldD/PmbA family protein [Candidatus Heimdallarchaeota archaeon]|nr:TldD/PmbA family protein [Candidatus Heimdallarchaeota archaeon]